MRIAVASQGLDVAPWFLHCSSYMCYRVERGMITDCHNMPNLSMSSEQTAHLMHDLGITVVISNNLEGSAKRALEAEGIETVEGMSGTASAVARQYVTNTLAGTEADLEMA